MSVTARRIIDEGQDSPEQVMPHLQTHGIVTEVLALLHEIPLGSYRIEMGLQLRQSMLINGLLFNSEGWQVLFNDDIKALEKVDKHLLRALLQAHAKVPLEFLYLETGSGRINQMISSRRMNYLQTILRREEEELTKRILREQQRNPSPGDFYNLAKDDFVKCGLVYDEGFILSAGRGYKSYIKKHIRKAEFSQLLNLQKEHSKVKAIKYEKLETQAYLKSSMFKNDDVSDATLKISNKTT